MSVKEECRWIGAQTLRLHDEFQSIARAIEYRHMGEAVLGIRYASETLEKFHTAGVFTDPQVKEYMLSLNEISEHLNWDRLAKASSKANELSDDIAWEMLNKLVECECRSGPESLGYHGGGRKN